MAAVWQGWIGHFTVVFLVTWPLNGNEAEDLADVIELMQNLSIPTKGCKTVDQMKEMIYEHLLTRSDNQLASNEVRWQ